MRDRWDGRSAQVWCSGAVKRRSRIRADLESKGVAPEFSESVADRLATIAPDFSSEEYSAANCPSALYWRGMGCWRKTSWVV